MDYSFDIEKIANYLSQFKNDLKILYNWNANIDKLLDLGIFSQEEIESLNSKTPFEKELVLKRIINQKLLSSYENDRSYFNKLCLWFVKDWGGIKTAKDADTIELVNQFLKADKHKFKRIASASKVGSYMYPEKFIIYDSRVAYSLNWILLSQNAGRMYFPIPDGRNSKMMAFDMNVLIRLTNVDEYKPADITDLDNRRYINTLDKTSYISEKEAYSVLNDLIKEVSLKLWGNEKGKFLYYTEMLLFSIADREVFSDITNKVKLVLN